MPGGKSVINGQYIVVLEYGAVTFREEHLAETIHRDVSDTQQDRFPESGGKPVCVFNRVFQIHFQGTDMSNVTNDLVKSLSKCNLHKRLRIVPTNLQKLLLW
jgi:hypothetical protein